jgi:hypothetical protein
VSTQAAERRSYRKPAISATARETFLRALAEGWTKAYAAQMAGQHRQRFHERAKADPDFAAAVAEAEEQGVQTLEQEALEMALVGVLEETRDGDGNLTQSRRRRDPQMVRFLLAAKRPEFYSERARLELTGVGGGPVEIQAGYEPTTLADLVDLAGELGVLDQLGYSRVNEVEGEAVEVLELPEAMS